MEKKDREEEDAMKEDNKGKRGKIRGKMTEGKRQAERSHDGR